MLKLLSQEIKSDKSTEKVQRFEANWDVKQVGNKLVLTATVEIDLASPATLAILKQLKPSATKTENGKTSGGNSFCCVATPTPKDFSDCFKGNVLVNIPKEALLPLTQHVEQTIKKAK